MKELNAPKQRLWSSIEDAYHRLRPQPSLLATTPAAAEPPSPPAASASQPSRKRVALTKLQPFITVGMTKDEVIAVAGTPTAISDDKLDYGGSEFNLKDGAVTGWKIDAASSLRVKLWPGSASDRTLRVFSVDSTKDDVLVVQGTPTLLSQDKFGYGASEVYFRNNRVVSWKNDPGSVMLRAVSR